MAGLGTPLAWPLGGVDAAELSECEQNIYSILRTSLPRFLFDNSNPQEIWGGYTKLFCLVKDQVDLWIGYSYINTAADIWLDQHARDRGYFRQESENDASLRIRIRTIEDVATRPALLSVVNAILVANGFSGTATMVEFRRDRAFFWTNPTTSRKFAYMSRGYRMGHSGLPNCFEVILPFGVGDNVRQAISDALRIKKAAGFCFALSGDT